MSAIHPAPEEISEQMLVDDPILKYFHYKHLPPSLAQISQEFCRLAVFIVQNTPRSAERTVALRKLLESKDCAVRSAV